MNILSKIFAGLTIFMLAACSSSYVVNSDYDRGVNFRNYTTYRIVNDSEGKGDPILNSSLNQKRINQAMNAEMQARGYTASQNDADLIIRYQTDLRDRQYSQNINPGFGYWGWWGGNNTQVRTYEQARLIINLIDAKTNQLVWQGWATGEAKKPAKDQDAAIRDQVYRIMQQYPHRAGGGMIDNDNTSRR
jgi:hypothetical protein